MGHLEREKSILPLEFILCSVNDTSWEMSHLEWEKSSWSFEFIFYSVNDTS